MLCDSEVSIQSFKAMKASKELLFRYPCSGISSVRLADGVYIPNFPSTRWEIHPCGVAHLPTNFLRSGGRAVSVEPSLPRWCGWVDPLTLVPGGVRELYRASATSYSKRGVGRAVNNPCFTPDTRRMSQIGIRTQP